jgi:hypothetical protein
MRPDKHFAIYEKTLKKKSEGQDHAYAR